MTDQIHADKVRKIIARYRDGASDQGGRILADLKDLLPARPRPTLADIPPEDRAACRRMQADVANHSLRYVIANPHDRHGEAVLIDDDGGIEWLLPEYVTPRPDLPRLEWPGDQEPAPAPAPALPDGWRVADHKDNGRVIVTNPTPSSDGRVYYVLPSAECMGFDWLWCDHSELTYIDQEADQ